MVLPISAQPISTRQAAAVPTPPSPRRSSSVPWHSGSITGRRCSSRRLRPASPPASNAATGHLMTDRTMDRTTRPLVIIGAFAGSLVVGLVLMLWALGGLRHVAAPAAIGGPFQLTDQSGQTVTEKDLQGRPTLIFFGFTHCPDVCPTELFQISEILRAMGKDADRVNAYFVSVDPERDTRAAMKDYLSSFDPHLKGQTGAQQAVGKVN